MAQGIIIEEQRNIRNLMKDLDGAMVNVGGDPIHEPLYVRIILGDFASGNRFRVRECANDILSISHGTGLDQEIVGQLRDYISSKFPDASYNNPCSNIMEWRSPDIGRLLDLYRN